MQDYKDELENVSSTVMHISSMWQAWSMKNYSFNKKLR